MNLTEQAREKGGEKESGERGRGGRRGRKKGREGARGGNKCLDEPPLDLHIYYYDLLVFVLSTR